jgi:hypothetical protein
MRTLGRLIYASSFVLIGAAGCSSSNGSNGGQLSGSQTAQLHQLCVQFCMKQNSCSDAGSDDLDCTTFCATASTDDGGVPPGCNFNKAVSDTQACINGSCAQLDSCFLQVGIEDGCSTNTNSSGSSSSSSSSSSSMSGTNAGTSCATCDKAATCCAAMGDASTCSDTYSGSTCDLAPTTADQMAYITSCQAEISNGKAGGVAACM